MKILDHHHHHGPEPCETKIVNPNYHPSSSSPPEETQYKHGEKDDKNELLLPKTDGPALVQ
jgi:hypothetical protein